MQSSIGVSQPPVLSNEVCHTSFTMSNNSSSSWVSLSQLLIALSGASTAGSPFKPKKSRKIVVVQQPGVKHPVALLTCALSFAMVVGDMPWTSHPHKFCDKAPGR